MVQVITLALADLSTHLAKQGYKMPLSIGFQFDNSGENKNRTVFAFLSHLVTALRFTDIYVSYVPSFLLSFICFCSFHINFLIVGHTHCSLDQYFSVISRAILNCEFIGSPEGLIELYGTAHQGTAVSQRPLVNRQVHAIYDWVQFYAPFINGKCFDLFFKFLSSLSFARHHVPSHSVRVLPHAAERRVYHKISSVYW